MTTNPTPVSRTAPSAGALLRQWRDLRGKSQLDLSLDVGVSQKHVSFVETGRSTPSRQMIVDLSDALGVPLRERNAIMLAAGYAPLYREDPLHGPSMREVNRAVARMLRQQEPFPALAMDRHWNVVETNEAAPAFFGRFVDLDNWPKPRNLLRLMFDPAGLQPCLAGWEETARSLFTRIRREAVGGVLDDKMRALLAELSAYPTTPPDLRSTLADNASPIIPLRFKVGDGHLSLFSMISTVGTPQIVNAEEIRLEMMFPLDDDGERRYLAFLDRTN